MLNNLLVGARSKEKLFKITGMDSGIEIEPYYVRANNSGELNLDCWGDSVRYYEEVK